MINPRPASTTDAGRFGWRPGPHHPPPSNLPGPRDVPLGMMRKQLLCGIASLAIAGTLVAAPGKDDPIEKGLKDAYKAYQTGDDGKVTDTLRALLKLMEEKNARKVEEVLPAELNGWKGNDLEREDLSVVGGGVSIQRIYQQDQKSVTIKVIKDSPLIDQWLKLLANDDLVQASGKKTFNVDGEIAIVEEELKVLIAVGGEILVELKGDNDCKSSDLVSLARKLELSTLKKMK